MSQTDHPMIVDDAALEELVRTAELPVLVDFYADWCGPCRIMAPILDQFAREHAGDVVVVKVNTDDSPDAATRYGIRGIPTMLIFKGGEEIDRQVGIASPRYLENLLATIDT